jgi:hypothetical protein
LQKTVWQGRGFSRGRGENTNPVIKVTRHGLVFDAKIKPVFHLKIVLNFLRMFMFYTKNTFVIKTLPKNKS